MKKTIVYIDGFNLYFGLKEKGWKRYYWLNLIELSKKLIKPDQKLNGVKYFTSRIKSPKEKAKRQNIFIEALETLPEIKIFYGKYQKNCIKCAKCGHLMNKPNEKMTDVNIAVEMMVDAFRNAFELIFINNKDCNFLIENE